MRRGSVVLRRAQRIGTRSVDARKRLLRESAKGLRRAQRLLVVACDNGDSLARRMRLQGRVYDESSALFNHANTAQMVNNTIKSASLQHCIASALAARQEVIDFWMRRLGSRGVGIASDE